MLPQPRQLGAARLAVNARAVGRSRQRPRARRQPSEARADTPRMHTNHVHDPCLACITSRAAAIEDALTLAELHLEALSTVVRSLHALGIDRPALAALAAAGTADVRQVRTERALQAAEANEVFARAFERAERAAKGEEAIERAFASAERAERAAAPENL